MSGIIARVEVEFRGGLERLVNLFPSKHNSRDRRLRASRGGTGRAGGLLVTPQQLFTSNTHINSLSYLTTCHDICNYKGIRII